MSQAARTPARRKSALVRRLLRCASLLRRADWVLMGAASALTVLGAVLVLSATDGGAGAGESAGYLGRHLLAAAVGVALMCCVVLYGLHRLVAVAPVLYAVSLLLVALVLTPLGGTVNGARRWLDLGGGIAFQPAEFVKVTLILAMALVLTDRLGLGEHRPPGARRVLVALALAAVPAALVLLTPDLGQALGVAVIAMAVLFVTGTERRWFLGLSLGLLAACLVVWRLELLDGYQLNRFAAFLDPELDPSGVGYNAEQARIAIGSGGLTGHGLFNGPQTTGGFVPEQHTDFVFSVAGEELGLLGGGAVIALLGVVLWRALRIAQRSHDAVGVAVAAGVCAWLAFQSFQNIGMNLGIMPVTGLPLLFVSYGGSSMVAGWVAIGLLQAVLLRSPVPTARSRVLGSSNHPTTHATS